MAAPNTVSENEGGVMGASPGVPASDGASLISAPSELTGAVAVRPYGTCPGG